MSPILDERGGLSLSAGPSSARGWNVLARLRKDIRTCIKGRDRDASRWRLDQNMDMSIFPASLTGAHAVCGSAEARCSAARTFSDILIA